MSAQTKMPSGGASFLDIVQLAIDQKKSVDKRKELTLALMDLTAKRLEKANEEWQKEIDKLESEELQKPAKETKSPNWLNIIITAVVAVVIVVIAVKFAAVGGALVLTKLAGAGFLAGGGLLALGLTTDFFKESFWVSINKGLEELDDILFKRILAEANKKHTTVQSLQSKTQQHIQLELMPLENKKQAAANLVQGALNAFRDIAESTTRR